MQVAAQDLEDDTDHVEDVQANKYVEPIDPHPDEFEDDDWINSIRVGHISSKFNRLTTPTVTDDLKVGSLSVAHWMVTSLLLYMSESW